MAEEAGTAAGEAGRMTMVVALDESEHSYYALQWTLRHFFSAGGQQQQYRLAVINAKPTAASAVGLAGPGAADVLPFVEADLKKSSMRVIDKARELCAQSRSWKRERLLLPSRALHCDDCKEAQAQALRPSAMPPA
ncbi:hypothetical protein GUJ93_ZPchr0009g637 [Zizania palustris]|uniref:UspA domain-containing protein n=1 Tax=Zizania palustris TaxID=103762 RepID=A0A8J5R1L4_ZIZPA|nr:hypothetical protein GUJ93_ZPchr0009g637 [Zizania palustris]